MVLAGCNEFVAHAFTNGIQRVQVVDTELPGVKLITPVRHTDPRGFFSEVFRADVLQEHGIDPHFVQENHSFSSTKGVLRGLHFQTEPMAQSKLVRVPIGAILDVAVDIRTGSPTFGRHVAVVLSAELGNQLFIPEGFAHGFCTLVPDTHLVYKVNRYYSAQHDKGIRWDDPAIGVEWPLDGEPLLSEKDRWQPLLAELPIYFAYQ